MEWCGIISIKGNPGLVPSDCRHPVQSVRRRDTGLFRPHPVLDGLDEKFAAILLTYSTRAPRRAI